MADMQAVSRQTLEWLADRSSRAHPVASIAEWLGLAVPKVQGSLAKLRDLGLVQYHEGDPGTWAITKKGYAEIRFDSASEATRFRMALEAINLVEESWSGACLMRRLAQKALST